MNVLLNLSKALALCLRELGSLVDDDVLFLVSLTTTHERLAYRPPQLSVETYVRSAREVGA
jgi:hypothetical protein